MGVLCVICAFCVCLYICLFAACREPKVSELVKQRVLPPQAPSRYVYNALCHKAMLDISCSIYSLRYIIMVLTLKCFSVLTFKSMTKPNWCILLSFLLRKTPVHKLYSSVLGQQLQSDGPTKGPPALPQLPQGFHHLYTHIEYECASNFYHHSGSARRTCLKTGKWSGRHVSCSPGEGSRGPLVERPSGKKSHTYNDTHTF